MSRAYKGEQKSEGKKWTAVLSHGCIKLIVRGYIQDENKKLEETEKRARMIVNERLSSLLTDIQDVMAPKETRKYAKMDIDMDDA